MDGTINSMKENKSSGFKLNPLYVLISILIIAGAVGAFSFLKQNKTSPVSVSPSASSNTSDTNTKSITLAEIATHKDAASCWMAIEGNIYDVTDFIPNHPGGDEILLGCGKDATAIFNSRPGDGTSHSDRARVQLSKYQIGVLSK